jgi:hypothetical protein
MQRLTFMTRVYTSNLIVLKILLDKLFELIINPCQPYEQALGRRKQGNAVISTVTPKEKYDIQRAGLSVPRKYLSNIVCY